MFISKQYKKTESQAWYKSRRAAIRLCNPDNRITEFKLFTREELAKAGHRLKTDNLRRRGLQSKRRDDIWSTAGMKDRALSMEFTVWWFSRDETIYKNDVHWLRGWRHYNMSRKQPRSVGNESVRKPMKSQTVARKNASTDGIGENGNSSGDWQEVFQLSGH